MSDLAIGAAPSLTGAQSASGDLFPVVDVSAPAGSKGKSMTRDELGDAMTRTAAMIAALNAKLNLAGGTMTGALNLSAGTNAAPSVNFGDSGTGFYKYATNNIGVACNGNTRWYWNHDGTLYNNGAAFVMNSSYGVMPVLYLRTNGLCLLLGASDDVRIERAAAASLQLGSNHATTPTDQTLKAHNVTTGTGAALWLCGGTGSVSKGAVIIGDATDMPAGFHGYSCPRADTGGASVSFIESIGTTVNDQSTFGGYSIGQVVYALQQKGILA